ncbi:hypothetical protein [Streptomyces brasiliensis]|uniref:Uncharacterized protein n=1 Tax=Streptomyces brasiliensis TaxID=1954 RepID=A0A917NIR3_9ACTN|nr:hypothetical protein [Streptomyces brasiliensis]GGJ03902.1 hypothetical protein GCM10010121_012770 [Streptomyces brasiliensis]
MAVDGKVLHGSRVPGRKSVWLLAAMSHAGTVLGHRQIADKSNETPFLHFAPVQPLDSGT